MDPEHIPVLINMGIGGVLLFLYMRQSQQVSALQEELNEVRHAQWELIVSLFGEERAVSISRKPKIQ